LARPSNIRFAWLSGQPCGTVTAGAAGTVRERSGHGHHPVAQVRLCVQRGLLRGARQTDEMLCAVFGGLPAPRNRACCTTQRPARDLRRWHVDIGANGVSDRGCSVGPSFRRRSRAAGRSAADTVGDVPHLHSRGAGGVPCAPRDAARPGVAVPTFAKRAPCHPHVWLLRPIRLPGGAGPPGTFRTCPICLPIRGRPFGH
jgi:hypothetical protein